MLASCMHDRKAMQGGVRKRGGALPREAQSASSYSLAADWRCKRLKTMCRAELEVCRAELEVSGEYQKGWFT